jgi:hypothetical protein
MPLTVDEFRSLADQFSGLARSIVSFEANNPDLSDSDFHAIDRLRMAALDYSDHFLIAAIQQTLKDLNVPLAEISGATGKMNDALKNLTSIGKAISIATAGIQLGAAIMTGQVPAIAQAIANVIDEASSS